MKWIDLGRYYLKQRIKYEVTDGWSADLAMFGAMRDTVNYLLEHSDNKDKDKATELVWDFVINHWQEILKSNKKSTNSQS